MSSSAVKMATWMRRQPGFSGIAVIAVTAHAMVTEQQRFLAVRLQWLHIKTHRFQSAQSRTRQVAGNPAETPPPCLILSTSSA
jgi:hypothetical protein